MQAIYRDVDDHAYLDRIGLPSDTVEDLFRRAQAVSDAARPHNTVRAYRNGRNQFSIFAATIDLKSEFFEDKETMYAFTMRCIDERKTLATIRIYWAAMRQKFKGNGRVFPLTLREENQFFRKLRGQLARIPELRYLVEVTIAHAFSDELVENMLAACDLETLRGKRDSALLTNGIKGMFRRSEMCAFDIANRRRDVRGHIFTVMRSKANQDGPPEHVPIPYDESEALCPVRAMDRYLDALGEISGPLFRPIDKCDRPGSRAICGFTVAWIIKDLLRRAGVPEDELHLYSSHSMRRTGITNNIRQNMSPVLVMTLARIARRSTLARYVEDPFYWLRHDQ